MTMGRLAIIAVIFCTLLTAGESSIFEQAEAATQQQDQKSSPGSALDSYRAVFDTYCVTCHNQRLRTANIAFDTLDLREVADQGDTWEKVIRKLRTGEMPPAGQARPDHATYDALASWLEDTLDHAARVNPNPGKPTLHRLNRTEYANAIRDLLALDIDVTSLLPQDDSTHGFDNIADALRVSPLLLEQYVTAARKISRIAIGHGAVLPTTEVYRAPADLNQDNRFENLPFGTRGGLFVRHHFPVDATYNIKVKLARNVQEAVIGLQEEHITEITLDGKRLLHVTVGGGKYAELQGIEAADAAITANADDELETQVFIEAGPHDIGVAFLQKTSALAEGGFDGMPRIGSVAISGPFDREVLKAPVAQTPSRERIFVCRPSAATSDHACAKTIVTTLARRAYRRPITENEVGTLIKFYETGYKTDGFEAGIELALRRILASPQFVFRFEHEPNAQPGTTYTITNLELASRLSFFLWSSIPDNELIELAEAGRLNEPSVLESQVRRMLADPKATALVNNFGGQWLYLRNLRGAVPNPRLFPEFDDNLRQAFRQETELLFESIMREDRSVLDLLDADYTFLNERLARHYGVPGIVGDHFRRISVTDPQRRGLLGHGSILTVTSYPTRTSPVMRGKWILENLLASPPPPPPPDVPELMEPDLDVAVLSMRERMVAHRANPVCAGCHAKLDPLGLALENFDAIGRAREEDVGVAIDTAGALRVTEERVAIDASGALPNGATFNGPAGLRQALLSRPALFVQAMTEKLFIYALGRGVEHYDFPAIRTIERDASHEKYSFSAIITGIVKSTPFLMNRIPEQPALKIAHSIETVP